MLKKLRSVFAVAILIAIFPFTPANAGPRAVIEAAKFDAGEIPQGKTILHDFIIRNTGDEQLTIEVKPC